MKWIEVYKLPLEHEHPYAFTKNGTMALMFVSVGNEDAKKIINLVNGVSNQKPKGQWTVRNGEFYLDDKKKMIFCIRGWGKLTGTGGYGLSEKKAIKIQDEFAEFVRTKIQR